MIIHAIDKKIREAFSGAALHYDMLTSLHKEIGRELIKKIMDHEPCQRILDIGMGTGWFTKRLTSVFPEAAVVGIDVADGMIGQAATQDASFRIVQADARFLPFKRETFDIITSNLAYQWVGDLQQSFGLCRSTLSPTGKLCLTMFGRDTFHELFSALTHCRNSDEEQKGLPIERLADVSSVETALHAAGFRNINVSSEHIKVRFEDMLNLVKWIKGIGANALSRDLFIGKDLLQRCNEYYNAHYADRLGVYATFEVIWVEAER